MEYSTLPDLCPMKTYTHFESSAGTLAIRFISTYQGVSDYGVSLCRANAGQYEARVSMLPDGSIKPAVSPEHWPREHGFAFEIAANTVRAYVAERFDADVREIVARGWLEDASDPKVKARAVEMGLVTAAQTLFPSRLSR